MQDDTLSIDDINSDFSKDTEPKDEHMLALLEQAYQGTLLCQRAIINVDLIKPFSDFQPQISEEYRHFFIESMKQMKPPFVYVYPSDGVFVMSDDYSAFSLFTEYKVNKIPCVVLGSVTQSEGVSPIGDPYQLQPPTIEQI